MIWSTNCLPDHSFHHSPLSLRLSSHSGLLTFLAHSPLQAFALAGMVSPHISSQIISSFLSGFCSNVRFLMMPFLPNLGKIATTPITLPTLKHSRLLFLLALIHVPYSYTGFMNTETWAVL